MSDDSVRSLILRIVASAFPALTYGYPRTYVVAAVNDDGTLDLVPPADAQWLPELENVEQWVSGVIVHASEGAEVLVHFRDANASRPVVVAFNPGMDSDAVPIGEEYGRYVRYGDPMVMPTGTAATPVAYVVQASPALAMVPAPPPSPDSALSRLGEE